MNKHQNQALEAEVIGVLLNADLYRTTPSELIATSGLTNEDFTNKFLNAAFGAIRAIADRGEVVDPLTVCRVLMGSQGPSEGIYEKVTKLKNLSATDPKALRQHAVELRELSNLRRLQLHYSEQLAELAKPKPDPKAIASSSEAFHSSLASTVQGDERGGSDILEISEEWDAALSGKRQPYLQTGIDALDSVFNGFVPNLNMVGGRASMGKTALIAEMVWNWIGEGKRVGVFGLEDGTKWLAERHLARSLGVPVGAIGNSRLHDYQQELCQAWMAKWYPVLEDKLCVYRRAGITSAELLAMAKKWIHVDRVQAIVIDHGLEIKHRELGAKERHDLAVKATMESLRDLAFNAKTPIIVLWHINRESAKIGQPTMESFKESGYLEAMSRTMLGLWEREDMPGRLLVTVVKATKGRRDVTVAISRDIECALVHSLGGEVVDLKAMRAAKRAEVSLDD